MSYLDFDFPHTRFFESDLRELIKQVFIMNDLVTNFVSINAIKYANPIQWDITKSYEKNTVVIDGNSGVAYISVRPVPPGVGLTREQYWTKVFDLSLFIIKAGANFANTFESEPTTTATLNTANGNWLVWDSYLYQALTDIHPGDRYVPGGNIRRATVEDFFNVLKSIIDNEIHEREAGDDALEIALNEETELRSEGDAALHQEIVQENVDRENADTTLQDNIDVVQGNVNAEAQARENADIALQGNIDAEALARENADAELRNLIEAGVSYYQNIAEFKSDESIQANKHYLVTGYYSSGDCDIMIFETSGTATGAYKEIVLDNGICAHLVKSNEAYFNVKQYGAYGDGLHNDYDILNDIINHARTLENSVVYLPQGEYIIDMYLEALKTSTITNDPRDFQNMTLCGDGISSIIHGKSETDKFDILQLNEACNINIKNLALTETSSAQVEWGVNGISLTNGCYNVTIEGVHVFDIDGYVDGYINGGKAFTVQTGAGNNVNVHDIFIRNCSCKNAPIGFEFDAPANSVQFRNIRVENCMFDVLHDGIVLSMPSWGSGLYAPTTDFHFVDVTVRSRQHCVNLSRGSQVYFDHCSFIQEGTPLYFISSDTNLDSFRTYASRLIYLSNSVFVSSFGANAIYLQTDGSTPSKFIVIKNVTIFDSFTGAGIDSNSYSNDCYIDNFQNMGAVNTITSIARACANTYLNNGGYQIMNNYLMTKTAAAKTLGSYSGSAIPVYNENGVPIGWLPLYN